MINRFLGVRPFAAYLLCGDEDDLQPAIDALVDHGLTRKEAALTAIKLLDPQIEENIESKRGRR